MQWASNKDMFADRLSLSLLLTRLPDLRVKGYSKKSLHMCACCLCFCGCASYVNICEERVCTWMPHTCPHESVDEQELSESQGSEIVEWVTHGK